MHHSPRLAPIVRLWRQLAKNRIWSNLLRKDLTMFCNSCGKELQPGQQVCSACGQLVGVARIPSSANRVSENVQVLRILWPAYSAFALLGAVPLWIVANTIFG